ncbi:MAG TPA: PQQ-dependent sugar dehydrogenase, partial [Polyangia bacterium]
MATGATALWLVAALGCDGSRPATATRAAFGLDVRPANPTCVAPARPPPTAAVTFARVYANVQLQSSVVLAQIPGDRSRWFVAERMGPGNSDARIVSFDAVSPADTPAVVATLGPLADVTQTDGEGGLIGMAFHPRFATNGRVYVSWVKADPAAVNGARSAVGYLTSSDGGAHFSDYQELFAFDQSTSHYHKGGGLQFGPDGLLYASFGDGGTGDDMLQHGQRRDLFFAKIHRIDVDHQENGKPYAIPDGNPFKHGGGQDTTFAWGFRNPFRFSIDRATNVLWVGDVGQERYEEIDAVKAGGNYGWPCREGMHNHVLPPDPRCPSLADLEDPVIEQAHNAAQGSSRAIIGGVVYRGKALPALVGTYLFADFAQRQLWAVQIDASSTAAAAPTLLNDSGTPQAGWV